MPIKVNFKKRNKNVIIFLDTKLNRCLGIY